MSHVRTQLRTAVALLVTGLGTTGDRVFTARVTPLPAHVLPALCVELGDEAITLGTSSTDAQLTRALDLRIECVSAFVDGLDDDLDQMALEVETAIATDTYLASMLDDPLLLTAIEREISAQAATPIGRLTLIYSVTYQTTNATPGVAL